eukprot:m.11227 g.11227  ORF g.11227 m.11227 type:complete len:120 (-) comp2831_c0_seq1:124-483(-)
MYPMPLCRCTALNHYCHSAVSVIRYTCSHNSTYRFYPTPTQAKRLDRSSTTGRSSTSMSIVSNPACMCRRRMAAINTAPTTATPATPAMAAPLAAPDTVAPPLELASYLAPFLPYDDGP